MTQAQMTTEQFAAWAKTAKFTVSQEASLDGEIEKCAGYSDDGYEIMRPKGFGTVWKIASAALAGGEKAEITYQTGVEWDGDSSTRFSDEFETYSEGVDEWTLSGITLVDDDGDAYNRTDMDESVLSDAFGAGSAHDLTDIDIDALLPAVHTEDIDMDTTQEIIIVDRDGAPDLRFSGEEIIIVERDGAPDLRFSGEEIASVSSKISDGSRWTVLKLYRTAGGKYICQSIGRTLRQGESDRYAGEVATDHAGVIAFLGQGRLAKELYDDAGIDNAQDVE